MSLINEKDAIFETLHRISLIPFLFESLVSDDTDAGYRIWWESFCSGYLIGLLKLIDVESR